MKIDNDIKCAFDNAIKHWSHPERRPQTIMMDLPLGSTIHQVRPLKTEPRVITGEDCLKPPDYLPRYQQAGALIKEHHYEKDVDLYPMIRALREHDREKGRLETLRQVYRLTKRMCIWRLRQVRDLKLIHLDLGVEFQSTELRKVKEWGSDFWMTHYDDGLSLIVRPPIDRMLRIVHLSVIHVGGFAEWKTR